MWGFWCTSIIYSHVSQPRDDQVCGHRKGDACGSSGAYTLMCLNLVMIVWSPGKGMHVGVLVHEYTLMCLKPCDQLLLEQWGRDHAGTTTITE